MKEKDLLRDLKLLISEDIELAFDTLGGLLTDNKGLLNEWILLRGRYNDVKSLTHSNTIPIETIRLELNSIRNAIISLVDKLGESKNILELWTDRSYSNRVGFHLYTSFQREILQAFEEYCKKHQFALNFELLITFLIDNGLITDDAVKAFTIKKEYDLIVSGSERDSIDMDLILKWISSKYNIGSEYVAKILKRVSK